MKRQATKYLALTISAIMAVSLTACGDGSDSSADAALTPVEAEPILSDLELEILNLETKYNKGEFEQADYLALADAYHRAGYIRKQRDILEQDYRLYNDTDAFAALQELSVNLEEETDSIRERAQEMQHDLELPEYLDESVNLIDSEDWFLTMMPKLKEGQRNYYLEQNNEPVLYAQVGYTEDGQCFSKVWYTGNDTKRFLSQEGTTIRMVTVTAAEAGEAAADTAETEEASGAENTAQADKETAEIQDTATPLADTAETPDGWSGAFEAWNIDSATGNIIHEQGTLQNGVLTGEYTCNVYNGDGPLEAYSLWCSREEREYITYTGTFDTEGKILTEQPSEDTKKKLLEGTEYIDLILYAYDADGENCLWQGIGAGQTVEDYRFGQEMIGLETRPEYTSYEVTEDMTDAANGADTADNTTSADSTGNGTDGTAGDATDIAGGNPQIRIYDGEVQWFDGKYWVSAGSVREMAKQDPFAAYEENHTTTTTGSITGSITGSTNGNASNANDGQNITGNTGTAGDKTGGSIQKPTPTPAATAKPATKPAASTPKPAAKPAATAKPTPAPTQAPAQDDHNDDHDDNNNDNNNNNNNNNDSNNNNNNDNNSSNDSNSGGNSGGDSGNSGGNDVDVEWTPDLM